MTFGKAKNKILYVITKGNWGGAQRYVYDLATSVPADKYEVAVALGERGLLAEKLSAARITTYSIASLQRNVSSYADLKSLRGLVRLFRTYKPDVVHLNSSKAGGLGALAARLAKVPRIVFTAHGWPFSERRLAPIRALIWLFSWFTALLAHRVIVVSEYDLRVARQMPFIKHKVSRIYNGIAPLTLGSGDIIRRFFPKGAHIVGTIGELTHNKNHLALIENAKNDPTLNIAIVGEGENRSLLQKKIEEYRVGSRVKLFGFMPAHEVLRGFDEFTLPSIKEGLPYVLIEARMAGLPIKARRVGGVGEILDANSVEQFSLPRMVEETVRVYEAR
jgi:glycosyltransferase involved in cell wall biosynthesis